MQFNENVIKGKWREIKGEVRKAWGKLTDDDLEKTKGDIKAIEGLIQQRYGKVESNSQKKLSQIIEKFEDKKEKAIDHTKNQLKN